MKFALAFLSLLSAFPCPARGTADQIGTIVESVYNEDLLRDLSPPPTSRGTWKQFQITHDAAPTSFINIHFSSMHIGASCTLYTSPSRFSFSEVVQSFTVDHKFNDYGGFWAFSVESSTM